MSDLDKIILNGTEYGISGSGAGGGITPVAQSLLINILRNGIYKTDQSTNITNLETELANGGGGATTVAIINTLTNCTSNNSASSISVGSSYMATITANTGYDITSATVTMGGVDVTTTVYSAGVITIPNVTGTLVITVTAESEAETGLVHYWDFKSGSLVDTIDGETTLTIGSNTTIEAGTGITIALANDYVTLPWSSTSGIVRAKVKFGAINRTAFGNERLIAVKNSAGSTPNIALRYDNSGGCWEASNNAYAVKITDPNAFENKEIELVRNNNLISVKFENQTIIDQYNSGMSWQYWEIGGSDGSAFHTIIIESVRMYEATS